MNNLADLIVSYHKFLPASIRFGCIMGTAIGIERAFTIDGFATGIMGIAACGLGGGGFGFLYPLAVPYSMYYLGTILLEWGSSGERKRDDKAD